MDFSFIDTSSLQLPFNSWWWFGGLLVWTLYWKGRAMWTAARRNEHWWFIVFLIINTLGILEILYVYVFSADRKAKASERTE